MKTKLLAILLVLVATLSVLSVCAYADSNRTIPGISPYYSYAVNPSSYLSLNGSDLNCTSYVCGNGVTKIVGEQTLQKKGILNIYTKVSGANWTKTVNDDEFDMYNTKYNISSGTYRLKTEFTLTASSGKTETVTVYSVDVVVP